MTLSTDPLNQLLKSNEALNDSGTILNGEALAENDLALEKEFRFLNDFFAARIKFAEDSTQLPSVMERIRVINHAPSKNGVLNGLAEMLDLSVIERILLLLVLEPHYNPVGVSKRLSSLAESNPDLMDFFSYYVDPYSKNRYPTLQSALFLLAGDNPSEWRECEQEILFRGKLLREQIIVLRDPDHRERVGNRLNQLIDLAPEYVDYLLHGQRPRPDFGRAFPASWVYTNLSWDQLVLNPLTLAEIGDVMDWVSHGRETLSISGGKINKSFPVLFYGPPGTGKSFTAKLIGKEYGKDVFRIDLSMIVSKYIGETEKNLAHLFDRAEGKDWILFFDEADALFGKRTGISDSKDKWANLEVSYLLQRMEEYQGLCILATNLKHNLDAALTRRFQAIIHFPFPKPAERALIWEKSLPPGFRYPENISFEKLGAYDLSGGAITNVIKASCVKAVKRGDRVLSTKDLSRFIKLEYSKDTRTPVRSNNN
ncbi:MAG TPA: ATP-binding protein [Bacteroidia bacterium]|nr:ATP-binding protein [Bacteroidia bacterium]